MHPQRNKEKEENMFSLHLVGTPRIGKYSMIPSLVTISRSRHHKIYDLLASWWRQNLIMQKKDEPKCWEYIIVKQNGH
jgi:hypothetical protein